MQTPTLLNESTETSTEFSTHDWDATPYNEFYRACVVHQWTQVEVDELVSRLTTLVADASGNDELVMARLEGYKGAKCGAAEPIFSQRLLVRALHQNKLREFILDGLNVNRVKTAGTARFLSVLFEFEEMNLITLKSDTPYQVALNGRTYRFLVFGEYVLLLEIDEGPSDEIWD